MGRRLGNDFDELMEIIRAVFTDKGGCVKARQDTLESHLKQLREEVEELAQATKKNDLDEINEELGHVLYDVFYYAILGERQGRVNLARVFKELNWSMKFRHPHVFEGARQILLKR